MVATSTRHCDVDPLPKRASRTGSERLCLPSPAFACSRTGRRAGRCEARARTAGRARDAAAQPRRRRATAPTDSRPATINAQVPGSGTADVRNTPESEVKLTLLGRPTKLNLAVLP
jgi:hypothetical protein